MNSMKALRVILYGVSVVAVFPMILVLYLYLEDEPTWSDFGGLLKEIIFGKGY